MQADDGRPRHRETRERSLGAPIQMFGERVAGRSYTVRRAAYAVIFGAEGRVATVKTRRGHFLPRRRDRARRERRSRVWCARCARSARARSSWRAASARRCSGFAPRAAGSRAITCSSPAASPASRADAASTSWSGSSPRARASSCSTRVMRGRSACRASELDSGRDGANPGRARDGRDRRRGLRVPDRDAHQPAVEGASLVAGGERDAPHAGRARDGSPTRASSASSRGSAIRR